MIFAGVSYEKKSVFFLTYSYLIIGQEEAPSKNFKINSISEFAMERLTDDKILHRDHSYRFV